MSNVEYKVLNFVGKVQLADFADIVEFVGDESAARDYVAVLSKQRLLIRNMYDSSKYELSAAGRSVMAAKHDNTRQRWLDRLWGFFSGVAVTVIGGVILQTLVG